MAPSAAHLVISEENWTERKRAASEALVSVTVVTKVFLFFLLGLIVAAARKRRGITVLHVSGPFPEFRIAVQIICEPAQP